jgi:hypothetical protein
MAKILFLGLLAKADVQLNFPLFTPPQSIHEGMAIWSQRQTTNQASAVQPIAPIPTVGGVAVPIQYRNLPTVWQCISYYESTWSTTAVNPSTGDSGAFQISQYMWNQFKDPSMPSVITQASLGQQLTVAERIQANSGWGQWEMHNLCGV